MKAVSATITNALQVGSYLKCIDNSGATEVQIIAVKGGKAASRRRQSCGIGNWIVVAVKKGDPKIRHEVAQAVVVRQRKAYRRRSGLRVMFEDNACVLVNEKGDPRGTRIKGPIAKEVVERFSTIGKIASMVV